jgi:hypothetical protein
MLKSPTRDCSLMVSDRFEASDAIRQKTGLGQSRRVVVIQPVHQYARDSAISFRGLSKCESPKALPVVDTNLRKIKSLISGKKLEIVPMSQLAQRIERPLRSLATGAFGQWKYGSPKRSQHRLRRKRSRAG